jgi:hypothetical protein
MDLMEADGVGFEDGEKVTRNWAMAAVLRGVKDAYAASFYQVCLFFFLFLFSRKLTYGYKDSRFFYSTSSTSYRMNGSGLGHERGTILFFHLAHICHFNLT